MRFRNTKNNTICLERNKDKKKRKGREGREREDISFKSNMTRTKIVVNHQKHPYQGRKGLSGKKVRILKPKRPGVITKSAIRRLCRRAGVKYISKSVYDTMRQLMKTCLRTTLQHSVIYIENCCRRTLTPKDVTNGVRSAFGHRIYGS